MGFRDLLQLVLGWWSRANPSAGCVEKVGVFTPGSESCGAFTDGSESVSAATDGPLNAMAFTAGPDSLEVDCHGRVEL